MSKRTRPKVRPCPLCGVAMQAGKSRENLPYFDRYECLSCHTVITEKRPVQQDDDAQD